MKYRERLVESPLLAVFTPWKSFDRVTPLFWIFLASLILWIIGASLDILSLFAWVGGFITLFFVAVAVAI